MRWTFPLVAVALTAVPLRAQAPRTGAELISRMHDRYDGKWYRSLTFTQRTVRPGRPDATWYEAAIIPGRLRIDVAPLDSANAFMFLGDSVYVYQDGKPQPPRRDRNLLMTLGFDVYGQPPATTIEQLKEEGIDLSRVRTGTWQGRPVWIVGAAEGDSVSNQFWVDQGRLLFVRLIQQVSRQGGKAMLEAQFNQYRPLAGGWIAMNVIAKMDGKPLQEEDYSDVRANTPLPDSLYETRGYHRPAWVR
jgi:hypothetical protein